MKEFELINRFFASHRQNRPDVIVGIGDDCAIVQTPVDQRSVMTIDTFIENRHFLSNTSAYDIGYKSLAISLSDMAAMGAEPAWAMLALILPQANEEWLTEFCRGFYNLLDKFSLALIGGNTAKGSEISITTQMTGFLPLNEGMLRSGAQAGDLIYVTGTLGDAGVALEMLRKKIKIPKEFQEELLLRLHRPSPRIQEGITLRKLATACIDISDGLIGDLTHILENSQVGATIKTDRLPLSKALRTCLPPEQAWQYALSSGDDYELCFTIPAQLQSTFEMMFGSYDCGYICIGKIDQEKGLRILDPQGKEFSINKKSYEHFA